MIGVSITFISTLIIYGEEFRQRIAGMKIEEVITAAPESLAKPSRGKINRFNSARVRYTAAPGAIEGSDHPSPTPRILSFFLVDYPPLS
jgi:hypothetical protein